MTPEDRSVGSFDRAVAALPAVLRPAQEELQAWMTEQRQQTKPQIQPIPEPKKFTPQAYTQDVATDPFSNQKLTQALKRESSAVDLQRGAGRAGTGPPQGAAGELSAGHA